MATEWHYGQGEEQHGPVPLEELKQLVASGQVQPTDMVWNADMPDWLPAQDVEELFPKQQPRSEPAAGQVPGRDQPSDTVPASSAQRSLRRPVIGLVTLCVIGIGAASFMFFPRKPTSENPPSEPKTEAEQVSEDVPEKVEHALATLKTTPTDPKANLVVGRYYCFRKNDWDKGLPLLVQGSDDAQKQLATTELTKPTDSEQQKKLGDAWWDFAGSKAKLAWKSSRQRAAHWYRAALGGLAGPAKADVEKRLMEVEQLTPNFEVLARRTQVYHGETHGSARCTNLVLEASKSPMKGPGGADAGLELKGARFLDVAVNASSGIKLVNKKSFAGFMVDYHTSADYVKRVALSIGVCDKDREDKSPRWGKNAVPDEYVDLGKRDRYELDLQQWAPPGWDGQVWFTLKLQQAGDDTSITARLTPLAKEPSASQEASTAETKGAKKPTDSPSGSKKGKKGKKKNEGA